MVDSYFFFDQTYRGSVFCTVSKMIGEIFGNLSKKRRKKFVSIVFCTKKKNSSKKKLNHSSVSVHNWNAERRHQLIKNIYIFFLWNMFTKLAILLIKLLLSESEVDANLGMIKQKKTAWKWRNPNKKKENCLICCLKEEFSYWRFNAFQF